MIDVERQVEELVTASFDAVPATTAAEIVDAARPLPRSPRRRWPAGVAALVVIALVGVLAAVAVDDGGGSSSRVGVGPHGVTAATDTDPVPSAPGEWTIDLGGEIPYPPVVAGGAAVVVSASPDFTQTQVLALDVATASRRWSIDLGSPVVSAPVAARGSVLLRLADDRLVALDTADGSVRWTTTTGTADLSPPPAVAGDTVYVGSTDGLVQAVRAKTGTLLWQRHLEEGVVAPPTPIARGLLVSATEMPVGSGGGALYVLDDRGRVVDRVTASLPALTAPAGRGGIVAFTTFRGDPDFPFQADPTDLVIGGRRGAVRHRFPGNLSAPVVTRGYVAAVSDQGVLRAYDTSDPERRLWTAEVGRNQGPQLLIALSRLVVTGSNLVAIDATSGLQRWTAPVSDAFLGVSDDSNRVIAISRTNGSLAVVDTRTGALVVDFALHDAPPGAVLHEGTLVWTGSGGVVSTARVP